MNNGEYDDKLLPHHVHYQRHLNPFEDAAIRTHRPPSILRQISSFLSDFN